MVLPLLPPLVLLIIVAVVSLLSVAVLGIIVPSIANAFLAAVFIGLAFVAKDIQFIKTDRINVTLGGASAIVGLVFGLFWVFGVTPKTFLGSFATGLGASAIGASIAGEALNPLSVTTLGTILVLMIAGIFAINAATGKKIIGVKK